MQKMLVEMAFSSDVGRRRRHNEDYVGYHEPADNEEVAESGSLYIVADGVGGGAAGEVASEYATKKVLYNYYRSADPDLGKRLEEALLSANRDLYDHIENNPSLGRMGTTMVAAALRNGAFTIANIGDSRAYLLRSGEIRQITRDHSLVAQLIEEGSITREEAEKHPKRNVILRSLGQEANAYVDLFDGRLREGDRLLLCSDGLTRHVQDKEILKTASNSRLERAVKQLVEMANVRGGKDNISVLILRVEQDLKEKPSSPATLTLREPRFDSILETASGRQVQKPTFQEAMRERRELRNLLLFAIVCGILLTLCVLAVAFLFFLAQ